MTLDIHAIMRLLPHRYPFLMIDRVEELEPGVSAVGVKCVSVNEPHFAGHFPGQPIMPGVLIAEAFASPGQESTIGLMITSIRPPPTPFTIVARTRPTYGAGSTFGSVRFSQAGTLKMPQ